jgi:hypothetical protein
MGLEEIYLMVKEGKMSNIEFLNQMRLKFEKTR